MSLEFTILARMVDQRAFGFHLSLSQTLGLWVHIAMPEIFCDSITVSIELGGDGPQALVLLGFIGQSPRIDNRIVAINVADHVVQEHHGAFNRFQFSFRLVLHSLRLPTSQNLSKLKV